ASGIRSAVLVTDSFGRAWRLGQSEVAIGCAGIDPLDDWRGQVDQRGREMTATVIATADQIAGASDLVRTKTGGVPAVVIRGLEHFVTESDGPGCAAQLRGTDDDLFR
ncbi:MAG: dehydro coenzyme reductase / coenzyme F420-0:L-glutamate ligase / coenzyme, partial [Actinomycetota bacterium]|nr:dehydro coenzyme reductase / coenzyme F420-0:L-glutamate ligase / coenzyme [Actinomycetota bacterium]